MHRTSRTYSGLIDDHTQTEERLRGKKKATIYLDIKTLFAATQLSADGRLRSHTHTHTQDRMTNDCHFNKMDDYTVKGQFHPKKHPHGTEPCIFFGHFSWFSTEIQCLWEKRIV